MKVQLPTGGTLVAWSDPAQAAPNDCALVFSLLPQVASYLASTECLFKVLQLVRPLQDLANGLSHSPDLAPAATKLLRASQDLVPCELAATPAGFLPFIKDLTCLVIKALDCLIAQLKTLIAILTALESQATGNAPLTEAQNAARKQAQKKVTQIFTSIDSIRSVLDLAAPMFDSAGMQPIQLPDVPSQSDLNSLAQLLANLQSSGSSLRAIADTLGGC